MLIRIGQELVINTAHIRWVEFGYNGDMRVPDAHFTRVHWADASAEVAPSRGAVAGLGDVA